ncbi:hypothetical protein M621_20570 [Serratia plymuthica S13]|uniref:Uncharacterized protein n=1 Tax=Serratia plymuthica S13 TaxID=1348660 RepID=S4YSP6_SERPL|nr:hypothetical protein M621_20570 [Serratia plymuthica S13]
MFLLSAMEAADYGVRGNLGLKCSESVNNYAVFILSPIGGGILCRFFGQAWQG